MTVAVKTSSCPFCMEQVATGAVRCKHCHAEISTTKKKSLFGQLNNFRAGFYAGVLLTLILTLAFNYYW